LSNAKYKYVKIQRKLFLEDDLAMIFLDFGLLRSLYCKISYLLAEEHWSRTNLGIWQPTHDSVCKDDSWIHGKCRQRFFYPTFTNVFFYFLHVFFTFLTSFIFISTFITSMGYITKHNRVRIGRGNSENHTRKGNWQVNKQVT